MLRDWKVRAIFVNCSGRWECRLRLFDDRDCADIHIDILREGSLRWNTGAVL